MSIIPQAPIVNPRPDALMSEIESEVSVEAAPLLQFIFKHITLIVLLVLLLVAAIVGMGGYQWYVSSTEKKAMLELGQVLTSGSVETRVKALEALLPKMPAHMQEGVQLELAAAAFDAGDLPKAAAVFGDVAKKGQNPLNITAAINQADILLKLNKFDEAIGVLSTAKSTSSPSLKVLVLENLAMVCESAKKYEQAISAYEEIIALDEKAVGRTDKVSLPQDIVYYKARISALQENMKPGKS